MAGNVRAFEWTEQRTEAAHALAEGQLAEAEIASAAGVSGRQLRRWKAHPDFRAKVAEFLAEIEAAVFASGIARKHNRLRALQDRWQRMQNVIEARAADPALAGVPGGKSGLLVVTRKGFAADTGLLRALLEHEKQAAIELGQWITKVAPTDPTGTKGPAFDGDIFAVVEQYAGILRDLRQRSGQQPGVSGSAVPGKCVAELLAEPSADE